jgi:hypothetical protein
MGPATVVALRRTHNRDGVHLGNLRRNNIHHHTARIHRSAAWHVEAYPFNRYPALSDGSTGNNLSEDIASTLIAVDNPCSAYGLFQGHSNVRVELRHGALYLAHRYPEGRGCNPVKFLGPLHHSGSPAPVDVFKDRVDAICGFGHVHGGTGNYPAKRSTLTAKIQHPDHFPKFTLREWPTQYRYSH